MNRFNFFTRPAGGGGDANNTTTTNAYDAATADPYSDRAPLSPRDNNEILPDDLEAAHPSAAATAATREMTERNIPATRFLHRFRPAIPSFFSTASRTEGTGVGTGHPYGLRPTSSHYSGAGLRGAPDTVVDFSAGGGGGGGGGGVGYGGLQSPKSDYGYDYDYRIGEQELNLPSTRLHLPDLERTWSRGSNGPPTRPGTGVVEDAGVAPPEPAVVREGRHERSRSGSGSDRDRGGDGHRERRRRRRGGRSGSGSHRSRRSGRSGRSGSHRSRDEESRSERRERRERRRRGEGSRGSRGSGGSRTSERRPPKHFLFCFPWVKSRRIRSQILRCFVSGMFVALTLSIYLSLALTQSVNSNEFTILLILIILFVTIFFCHSLIRLIMLVVKARKREQMRQEGRLPEMTGSSGYAIPHEPIPVVLARDEEAAGIESEATKTGPPAYGVWRESVRVDPNRLYWMRNEQAPVEEVSDISSSNGSSNSESMGSMGSTGITGSTGSTQSSRTGPTIPRPPSYSSDDGVSYVVDARPRSMAPRANAPPAGIPHPSETGMSGSWL